MPTRRQAIKTIVAGAALAGSAPLSTFAAVPEPPAKRNGNIRHSICRWCLSDLSLDDLCAKAKEMGCTAIDLVGPADWHILKKYGLDSSMCNGAEINLVDGWNEPKNHPELIKRYSEMIPKVAENGYKNLICFTGNRRGMDDSTGLANCVEGLRQVMPLAEKHGVVLCLELFNSKVDHKDYMADSTEWGVALCKALGSDNFKLLYDIYHMQINEGDVIRNIQQYHPWIAHYHTAGVPGRHEIDDTQELFYPAIMRAIVKTGFKGYVAQEFIATNPDKIASFRKAIDICDV